MTAEIAILNRTAVALAADSAVTLTIQGQQKTNNSSDKLFQLVHSEPVGIMIYGNAEFMGVPFETVIKEFRSSVFSRTRDTLKEYSEAFFQFMQSEISISKRYRDENIYNIVFNHLSDINQEAVTKLLHHGPRARNLKLLDDFVATQINVSANAMTTRFEALPENKYVSTVEGDPNLADIITRVIKDIFPDDLSSATVELLKKVAYLSLKRDIFSRSCSGLVFAGFGKKEIFPKLHSFYSDGYVAGDIKRLEANYVDIDREGINAHIEPFAQKEMVERFLDGIDPTFENYIYSSMETALTGLGREIVDRFVEGSRQKKVAINSQVSKVAASYLESFRTQSSERKKGNYRQRVLDMVHYMPKSDLANMAESLINLTSTKRKVSAESETVGGPIDVAVISKHEGFVWIKRKHYFNADLNPRYFLNQQRELAARDENGNPVPS